MSNISNKPNESSKNKSTKSIAEEMGFKRVQSGESEKSIATPEPKVKRKKKGLEQITKSQKQVSDRSIHFSDSSSAMDAHLSKMEKQKLAAVPREDLGKLVNEGDLVGGIEKHLSRNDRLNVKSLNKTSAQRRPSGDKLRVVLTEGDLDVSNNNNKLHEKLEYAKANGLKIAIRTSLEYVSQNEGGFIDDFIKFARNNQSVLSNIEILDFRGCRRAVEALYPIEDFKNVLKQCTNIERLYCDGVPGKDVFTLEGLLKLTHVGLGVRGTISGSTSVEFKNLPKLESVYVNTWGSITFEDLPKLSECRVENVVVCLRFIGEFPVLRYFGCRYVKDHRRTKIIFPQKLNSLKDLFFGQIESDCITFPQELEALENIAFLKIKTRGLMTLQLPNLPNLKKIEYEKGNIPENIVKTFEDFQSQIDARAEKAKGESS